MKDNALINWVRLAKENNNHTNNLGRAFSHLSRSSRKPREEHWCDLLQPKKSIKDDNAPTNKSQENAKE
jgi:hypothetical protein